MRKTQKSAVAYLRVSTEQQEGGHGLHLQEVAIHEYAARAGYKIVQTFSDACTGMGETSISKRPGARAALAMAMTQGCPILVDTLSRFLRNVEGLKQVIARKKIAIISAREGAGLSEASMMSAAARSQREGELISASTKKALAERKARGVPLGNRVNLPEAQAKGVAVVQERVARQVRELGPVIQELRRSGKATAREIAEGLNQRGYRTARHEPWKGTTLRRLLAKVPAEVEPAPPAAPNAAPNPVEVEQPLAKPAPYRDNPLWGVF